MAGSEESSQSEPIENLCITVLDGMLSSSRVRWSHRDVEKTVDSTYQAKYAL